MIAIDLVGMSAIVTGGAAGIGAACVAALMEAGARVISLDVTEQHERPPHEVIVGDVTEPEVRARAISMLGPGPSILINNAAIQFEQRLDETTDADLERLFSINVFAGIRMTREYAKRAEPGGSVVMIGSVLGVTGDPALAVYSTAKGAVINFTRTAALEYAGRLRVNAILPGAIRTPLTTRAWKASADPVEAERRMTAIYPAGRIGDPSDVGNVAAFLASPLASFMTGALVAVDGGLLAANAEWGLERL